MAALFVEFYQDLFQTSNLNHTDEVLGDTTRLVSTTMNSMLAEEFTKMEVDYALKQMSPLKAPGPNGMPLVFY